MAVYILDIAILGQTMAGKYMLKKVVADLETSIIRNVFSSDEVAGLLSGRQPLTATHDYSDVFVVSGGETIAWPDISRISDSEMREINRKSVDVVYDVLVEYFEPQTENRRMGLAELAKYIACRCFRNTEIERYHGGPFPGGFGGRSDAVVRHGGPDIAWKDVARLNSSELLELLEQGSSSLREILRHLRDRDFMDSFAVELRDYVRRWDMPSGYYRRDG
jgi:hypothetical protein